MAASPELKIFLAWQSDLDPPTTRDLQRTALEDACARIRTDSSELNPVVDYSDRGLSGMPDLKQVVQKKLHECSLFVGDLSFVGGTIAGKKLPNPNVLLEMGYAARRLGWQRVVSLMNLHYGGPEDLNFNLRGHRHPITYELAPGMDLAQSQDRVSKLLEEAIREAHAADMAAAHDIIKRMDATTQSFVVLSRNKDCIDDPVIGQTTLGGIVATQGLRDSIRYLLDHGVVEYRRVEEITRNDSGQMTSALVTTGYRWTYLGRRVVDTLASQNLRIGGVDVGLEQLLEKMEAEALAPKPKGAPPE